MYPRKRSSTLLLIIKQQTLIACRNRLDATCRLHTDNNVYEVTVKSLNEFDGERVFNQHLGILSLCLQRS